MHQVTSQQSLIQKIYAWLHSKIYSMYAPYIFFAIFCLESIIIVPVTSILALFCLERRSWSFYYATIATLGSLVGGCIAYCLGFFLWDVIGQKIVTLLFNPHHFAQALELYKKYQFATIFIAGFTPIPYKIITLSAGFCRLPFIPFFICSGISRALRFFLVAGAIYQWGPLFKHYLYRYATLLLLPLALGVGYLIWACL